MWAIAQTCPLGFPKLAAIDRIAPPTHRIHYANGSPSGSGIHDPG